MPKGLLLTTYRVDGIRSFDCLSPLGLPRDRGGGISTSNARTLGIEVQDHVGVPIAINILQGRLHWSSLSAGGAKADRGRVNGGGIESGSCQDGYRDYPFALRMCVKVRYYGLWSRTRRRDLDRARELLRTRTRRRPRPRHCPPSLRFPPRCPFVPSVTQAR